MRVEDGWDKDFSKLILREQVAAVISKQPTLSERLKYLIPATIFAEGVPATMFKLHEIIPQAAIGLDARQLSGGLFLIANAMILPLFFSEESGADKGSSIGIPENKIFEPRSVRIVDQLQQEFDRMSDFYAITGSTQVNQYWRVDHPFVSRFVESPVVRKAWTSFSNQLPRITENFVWLEPMAAAALIAATSR